MDNDFSKSSLSEIGEAIQGAVFILGQTLGITVAADRLREKAGWEFAHGDESVARVLKDLSKEFAEWAKETRKPYDETYNPREGAAFQELERRDALSRKGVKK